MFIVTEYAALKKVENGPAKNVFGQKCGPAKPFRAKKVVRP